MHGSHHYTACERGHVNVVNAMLSVDRIDINQADEWMDTTMNMYEGI